MGKKITEKTLIMGTPGKSMFSPVYLEGCTVCKSKTPFNIQSKNKLTSNCELVASRQDTGLVDYLRR